MNPNPSEKLFPPSPNHLPNCGPDLNRHDFDSASPLGQGSFGKVFKVTHKKNQRQYAIKVVSKPQIINMKMLEQLKNEVSIMSSVKHPCIIELYTYYEDETNLYLVLELAEGHIYSKLKKTGKFPESQAAKLFFDVVRAVEHLHNKNPAIIHRDIKPENLLMVGDTLKLCDFGWSNIKEAMSLRVTYCGTPDYLAPEMITGEGHNEKLDIWTLGILMHELLTGKAPFTPKSVGRDRKEKMKELEENVLRGRIDYPPYMSGKAITLIGRILQKNPQLRPSASQILQDGWFRDHGLSYGATGTQGIGTSVRHDRIVRMPSTPEQYSGQTNIQAQIQAITIREGSRERVVRMETNPEIYSGQTNTQTVSRREGSQERIRYISPNGVGDVNHIDGGGVRQIVRTNSPVVIRSYQQQKYGGGSNNIIRAQSPGRDQSPGSRAVITHLQKTHQGVFGGQPNQTFDPKMAQTGNPGFLGNQIYQSIYEKPPTPSES